MTCDPATGLQLPAENAAVASRTFVKKSKMSLAAEEAAAKAEKVSAATRKVKEESGKDAGSGWQVSCVSDAPPGSASRPTPDLVYNPTHSEATANPKKAPAKDATDSEDKDNYGEFYEQFNGSVQIKFAAGILRSELTADQVPIITKALESESGQHGESSGYGKPGKSSEYSEYGESSRCINYAASSKNG